MYGAVFISWMLHHLMRIFICVLFCHYRNGNVIHQPLFRDRSWTNGTHCACMFYRKLQEHIDQRIDHNAITVLPYKASRSYLISSDIALVKQVIIFYRTTGFKNYDNSFWRSFTCSCLKIIFRLQHERLYFIWNCCIIVIIDSLYIVKCMIMSVLQHKTYLKCLTMLMSVYVFNMDSPSCCSSN